MSDQHFERIVMVSNRLPISLKKDEKDKIQAFPGSGGLITALTPLLKHRNGLWIGWAGCTDIEEGKIEQVLPTIEDNLGFDISPVILDGKEWDLYYNGFSNEIIWPLFHDLQSDCNFVPNYWYGYQAVNKKFAEKILKEVNSKDFLWIHDYHLLLTAQELRKKGFESKIAFFLHIPFPPLDVFLKLPWRFEFLNGLLEYDLVGFQTMRDKRNFIQCVNTLLPHIPVEKKKGVHQYRLGKRNSVIGVFPISIDYNAFTKLAADQKVAKLAWLHKEKFPDQKIIFSIDRLDLTKGIPYRLRAIRHLLENHPDIHNKISFIQVVQPSRTDIPVYKKLKDEIDRLVGEINSKFTKNEWVPIKYMYRTMEYHEVVSYFQISDICLVTPFKDGMNLVSKEYPASKINDKGILILSEFAGSCAQLHKDAFLVNPYDIEGISKTIYKSLYTPEKEQVRRMKNLRRKIKTQDIYWWIESFLETAFSKNLKDFQVIEEYLPSDSDPVKIT